MTNSNIESFLLKNGFKKKKFYYGNNNCSVMIYENQIIIEFNHTTLANKLDIYWLIGILTYHNLINKNYKI